MLRQSTHILNLLLLALLLPAAVAGQQPLGSPSTPAVESSVATSEQATEVQAQPAPSSEPSTTGSQEPATNLRQTVQATGEGVVAAAGETVSAMQSGGNAAVRQTRAIWTDVLTPMWQQFASAVPGLVKALILLLAFWLIAIVVSTLIRRALGLLKLDERAEKHWDLGGVLGQGAARRSLEGLLATLAKWLILLVGFIAFFQAIELQMVADPLQNVADRILAVLPNLLQAGVILLVYWIVASLARIATVRGLGLIRFDERWGKRLAAAPVAPSKAEGDQPAPSQLSPSQLLGRLAFFVVLLLGLGPFLDALGQDSLVAPLGSMLEEGLGFIPNLVAALILFFIGRTVAMIVREVVTNFLAATGSDAAIARIGGSRLVGDRKASAIVGSIAYFVVFVPVLVAAVDALGVRAISDPVETTLTQLLSAVPLLFVAILLVLVGLFVARTVAGLVRSLLQGIGADQLPERLGLGFLQPKEGQRSISELVSATVQVLILLFVAQQALATLQLDALATLVANLIAYLPALATGLAIILLGISLGSFAGRMARTALAGKPQATIVGFIAQYAVVFVAFGMGLTQLGLGEEVVSIVVAAVLGGAALGIGLAVGLGAKDKVKQLVDQSKLLP